MKTFISFLQLEPKVKEASLRAEDAERTNAVLNIVLSDINEQVVKWEMKRKELVDAFVLLDDMADEDLMDYCEGDVSSMADAQSTSSIVDSKSSNLAFNEASTACDEPFASTGLVHRSTASSTAPGEQFDVTGSGVECSTVAEDEDAWDDDDDEDDDAGLDGGNIFIK